MYLLHSAVCRGLVLIVYV